MTKSTEILNGVVGLVTGAANGMGAEMTLALLSGGASVVALDISERDLASLFKRAAPYSGQLATIVTDVSQDSLCEQAVALTLEKFGGLDVLVNDAGIGMRSIDEGYSHNPVRFWDADPARWRRLPRRLPQLFLQATRHVHRRCHRRRRAGVRSGRSLQDEQLTP